MNALISLVRQFFPNTRVGSRKAGSLLKFGGCQGGLTNSSVRVRVLGITGKIARAGLGRWLVLFVPRDLLEGWLGK